MTRLLIAFLFSALLTLYAEQAGAAEGRRVALVVGVGAYDSVPQLPNAVNDATAMAELFRKAGFDVVTARSDVSNLELKRAIREFEDAVTDADIAVVFYAGHGIEIRETNYLIPTDAKLVNERDAEDEAISLDRIITALEPAKRLRLVILDACRDNPFASKMKRRVATRAITAGLGKIEPQQTDTLIAYAAKEKSVANDGTGAHSPFTTALLGNLTVPGLDVRLAFGRVRDDVLKATGRQQEPFVYGSLGGGTVALVPVRAEASLAAPAANVRSDAELAKSDYEIVERVGSKAAWEVFLNTHKSGLYAELARVQLAKLAAPALGTEAGVTRVLNDASGNGMMQTGRTSPPADVPPVAPVPKPTAAEQRAWDRLKASQDRAGIAKFIDTFRTSPLVGEAQARLEMLERQAEEREEAQRQEREAARQKEEDDRQRRAADAERKRLEQEAARQKAEAERARAAEAARLKAEAQAAAKQREAEERARAAEAAARRREDEEAARLAEIAARKREAEERARVLAAERAKLEAETAARKREADEAAGAIAAAKAAREAEERVRLQAAGEQHREEQARSAEKAAAEAARVAEETERARAAAVAAKQREAEARQQAADAERAKAETEEARRDREDAERARVAEAERRKAKAAAEAERRRAEAAAEAAADLRAERAAAARKREAAERAREAAEEAAAANRRKAQEASRRAAERQAERAAAAAEQRRAATTRARAAQASRPAPAPRARAEARTYHTAAPRASGGGGGAAPMVGIGF